MLFIYKSLSEHKINDFSVPLADQMQNQSEIKPFSLTTYLLQYLLLTEMNTIRKAKKALKQSYVEHKPPSYRSHQGSSR